ncbi:glycosyltransferase family 2 protein [Curvibacter lanceolatus]|uniref:glycosyltransferase family 2 protein n=1 Tax=Curvibacter lanceolatus TaxID=86182 RepID=UPI0004CF10DB|nr:glycosyltransferase family A protein [Curvibacter lanceolatus]
MPEVSVCVCTFRRPELLDGLLSLLAEQRLPAFEIVVVDNDPAHSALPVLQAWGERLPLRFVHLPEPNIAKARNLAVAQARGAWLAFIDDDERPGPDWLYLLVQAQAASGADGVMAPVLPTYTQATPEWMRDAGLFDRRRFSTGTRVFTEDSRTGNVLLRTAMARSLPGPFDPEFGRSGGEDTLFFSLLHRAGFVFVWCDEAVVTEEVPADRARVAWVLRRAYRGAQTFVRVELYPLNGRRRTGRALSLALRALLQLGVASLLALGFSPVAPLRAFHWLRVACAQLGKLSALMGARYLEYRA